LRISTELSAVLTSPVMLLVYFGVPSAALLERIAAKAGLSPVMLGPSGMPIIPSDAAPIPPPRPATGWPR